MNFTVYNKTTGQILRTGSCPPDQFNIQAQGNEIIDGSYADNLYYWDNGFKEIPPKPQGFYDFNYTTKKWVLNETQTINVNRSRRNELLLSSDWTQLSDVDLTASEKTRWKQYRQKLRDMTEQDFLEGNFPIF